MQTVKDEKGLSDSGKRLEYVRSKCDPRVLICCRTGDTFTRADGAPWEWPGYKSESDASGRQKVEPATAVEDTVRYQPDGQQEAVEHFTPHSKRAA